MTCIRTMQKTSPPILVKVGSAHVRYVAFGHHQSWTVNFVAAVERITHGEDVIDDPRDWTVPRMWLTLDGAVDRSVYETCLHAVLTHIADKPGISKVWCRGCPVFWGVFPMARFERIVCCFWPCGEGFLSYQRYLTYQFY